MSQSEDGTIFNRQALALNRANAARKKADVAFLLEEVMDEMAFRLKAINREFEQTVSLGSHMGIGQDELHATTKFKYMHTIDPCAEMLEGVKGSTIIAEEDCLPLRTASIDMIISPLVLQWVNDLPGCLIQIRRALKNDGLFMAAIIGGESLHELRASFLEAESTLSGGVHPRISPFVDVRNFGGLLQRAGFALPVIDREIRTVRYDTPYQLMKDLQDMGASNILHSRDKKFLRRDILTRMMEIYHEKYSDDDGRIRASFEIIYASAWAPDESQPKPLKPGSATHSLAEALKSGKKEHSQ